MSTSQADPRDDSRKHAALLGHIHRLIDVAALACPNSRERPNTEETSLVTAMKRSPEWVRWAIKPAIAPMQEALYQGVSKLSIGRALKRVLVGREAKNEFGLGALLIRALADTLCIRMPGALQDEHEVEDKRRSNEKNCTVRDAGTHVTLTVACKTNTVCDHDDVKNRNATARTRHAAAEPLPETIVETRGTKRKLREIVADPSPSHRTRHHLAPNRPPLEKQTQHWHAHASTEDLLSNCTTGQGTTHSALHVAQSRRDRQQNGVVEFSRPCTVELGKRSRSPRMSPEEPPEKTQRREDPQNPTTQVRDNHNRVNPFHPPRQEQRSEDVDLHDNPMPNPSDASMNYVMSGLWKISL